MITDKQGNILSGATHEDRGPAGPGRFGLHYLSRRPLRPARPSHCFGSPFCHGHHRQGAISTPSPPNHGGGRREAQALLVVPAKLLWGLSEREASTWRRGFRTYVLKGNGRRPPRPSTITISVTPTICWRSQSGHLIDFFHANARNLRDRIARVLPKWIRRTCPAIRSSWACRLSAWKRAGDYARAEDTGRRALDLNPPWTAGRTMPLPM